MVRFQGISKAFSGVQALDGVSFDVQSGSVHGLCGENGAGKSTLLKVLSGVHPADSGSIEIDGQPCRFRTTQDALLGGVAVIYQELNLVPDLSVAENVWLGHFARRGPFVDRAELARRTIESLRQVGLEIGPWARLGSLSLAQRQMVEIAKALSRNARVIAFDEPTSSLSAREVVTLFDLIADLRRRGLSVLYVSHRMDEVTKICDAVTVLRDGRHIETFPTMDGVDADTITHRMVGREMGKTVASMAVEPGEVCLELRAVMGRGLARPVDLKVRTGEIVGFFGLVGAGRTELLKAVFAGNEGEVLVNGEPVPRGGPRSSIENGIVFCPEDRKKEGLVPMLSVSENINLSIRRSYATLGIWLSRMREARNTDAFIQRLRIKTRSARTEVSDLSGGNQQKVILARWLSENVKVILLDEPTRGIDVGAKAEIYEIVRGLAAQKIGVVFVSSELPEILALSTRVIVMCDGRITGEMPTAEATEQKLLDLALPKSAGNPLIA